jgi:hypothetical protein
VTLLVFVVVAGATGCGGVNSPSSQKTSVPSVGAKYISKRYGYEIVLRGTFGMVQALAPWDGSFPFGSSGRVDVIVDRHDRKFIVAAKPVSPGMTLSRWEAFVVKVKRQACHGLRNFRASSLGGEPAREFLNSCPGYDVITLAALHRTRGYLLEYLSPAIYAAAPERRAYEAGRRAFAFTHK